MASWFMRMNTSTDSNDTVYVGGSGCRASEHPIEHETALCGEAYSQAGVIATCGHPRGRLAGQPVLATFHVAEIGEIGIRARDRASVYPAPPLAALATAVASFCRSASLSTPTSLKCLISTVRPPVASFAAHASKLSVASGS